MFVVSVATAAPPGFVKWSIPLSAPPVGLAFDSAGVLYALEGADFLTNVATLRTILSDGTFGGSFSVPGDDPTNLFVGSMAYDPWGDQLLISDNTADGRLYAVSNTGVKQTLATGIAAIAGVAVRGTGEIFVSTAIGPGQGAVLQIDRTSGATSVVLSDLDYGAGLAFDAAGDLIVQDADATTFRGRLRRVPITETPGGLDFGTPIPLIDDMQSSAGVAVDSENDIFTTGSGGLFRIGGAPLMELPFDDNGNPFQFATAIAFDPGSLPFERFSGPDGGRLAYMADFGFAMQDLFVTMLTPARPGDYNADGSVDGDDYSAWSSAFASTTQLAADGNGDGMVDAADYVIWRRHSEAIVTDSPGTRPLGVPEPSTAASLFALAVVSINFRRRSKIAVAEWARSRAKSKAPALESRSGRRESSTQSIGSRWTP
jgi:hypothetical protein